MTMTGRFDEQLLEQYQCRKCNMRIACDQHWKTPGPIKHSRRQFHQRSLDPPSCEQRRTVPSNFSTAS